MDDPTTKQVMQSKEYKAVIKCAAKKCADYSKILKKEEELLTKMTTIRNELIQQTNIKGIIRKRNELLKISEQMSKLNDNKKALLCIMSTCGKETADLFRLKSHLSFKAIEKEEKQIQQDMKFNNYPTPA